MVVTGSSLLHALSQAQYDKLKRRALLARTNQGIPHAGVGAPTVLLSKSTTLKTLLTLAYVRRSDPETSDNGNSHRGSVRWWPIVQEQEQEDRRRCGATTHFSRTFRPNILPRCDGRSLQVNGLSRPRNVRAVRRKSRSFLGAKTGDQTNRVRGQALVKPSSSGVSSTISALH
jgi:hypothetical protein